MLPPKNNKEDYYKILGVSPSAKEDEIKDAYRKKAKEIHPDTSDDYDAGRKFVRLSQAYKTLRDREEKTIYDLSMETGETFSSNEFKEKNCVYCRCKGENLRYVIFYEVIKTDKGNKKKAIQGVFCDKCAKKIAIIASFRTWLNLFSGGVKGIKNCFDVLVHNLKGGVKPSRLNFKLLYGRAKWHFVNDRPKKAAFCAYYAEFFARTVAHKNAIKNFRNKLKKVKFPKARGQWQSFNQASFVQLTPLWIMIVILFYGLYVGGIVNFDFSYKKSSYSPREQENIRVVNLPNNPSDENFIYYVDSKELVVYKGPGIEFSIVDVVKRFETVRITGLLPSTSWVKIVTRDGVVGFVISDYLKKGEGTDSIETISRPGSDVRSLPNYR